MSDKNPVDIFVGDLHVMPSNLEDTDRLFQLIQDTAQQNNARSIIFTGDIFHTHAVVRQEVGHLVKLWMRLMATERNVIIVAGNHDGQSPHSVRANALRMVLSELDGVQVMDSDFGDEKYDYAFVPFMASNDDFIKTCEMHKDKKILVCHQTVTGAYYENKTLAPGGVAQELIPQPIVIAGHIHMEQTVGKVVYVGTPRPINASEYNQPKGIFLYTPALNTWKKVSTDHLVKLYFRYDITQGSVDPDLKQIATTWKKADDISIIIKGDEAFYKSKLLEYEWLSGRAKIIPDVRKQLGKTIDVESDGNSIQAAFHQYVHEIYDADEPVKKQIWLKLQEIVPNLGSRP